MYVTHQSKMPRDGKKTIDRKYGGGGKVERWKVYRLDYSWMQPIMIKVTSLYRVQPYPRGN